MMIGQLAERFFTAIEAGDTAALRDLYSADAVIWHNDDQAEQTVDENLRVLGWLARTISDLHYQDIRRVVHDDGFVQQHLLTGILPDGSDIAVPAALFVTVVGERIARLDEYVDSAHIRPLHALAARRRANAEDRAPADQRRIR